jgi:hypothetical protein
VPDYCICLDSETCDYSRIWMTTSIKGMCTANVRCRYHRTSLTTRAATVVFRIAPNYGYS